MTKKKYPFGIVRIDARKVSAAEADIDDHISKRFVSTTCWPNGEGFTLRIQENKRDESMDITWVEWAAMKLCVKEIQK